MSEAYVPKLGKLCDETDRRDAVHIALAPVTAAQALLPGQRVELNGKGEATFATEGIGIVDPFLQEPVKKGDRFWLMLLPGTITGLRHQWTHPAFAPKIPTLKEE